MAETLCPVFGQAVDRQLDCVRCQERETSNLAPFDGATFLRGFKDAAKNLLSAFNELQKENIRLREKLAGLEA